MVPTPLNSTLSSSHAATRMATLHNGVLMPMVGFGCAGYVRKPALLDALSVGYRLFDTAQAHEWYLEEEVGDAIAEGHVNRSELFLTSKLHPRDLGATRTLEAFPDSLRRLRTTYLDAFLLHYPRCFGTLCAKEPEGDWRAAWGALETLYARGEVRAIGVSNFGPAELQQLLDVAKVKPHLVQSWMDPLHAERPLRALCARHGVQFQAYSSLGTQHQTAINPVLRHPALNALAQQLGVTVAQVVLRWAVQHGAAVIPRSRQRAHMASSLDLEGFELSAAQMAAIDALDGTDAHAVRVPPSPPKLCPDNDASCEKWVRVGVPPQPPTAARATAAPPTHPRRTTDHRHRTVRRRMRASASPTRASCTKCAPARVALATSARWSCEHAQSLEER